ncbi:hypothetical protein QTP86_002382 [Hemibagrus guttatus]|nr:hypothetical protein QTP86_002382 [Hemibagrus guttatus]
MSAKSVHVHKQGLQRIKKGIVGKSTSVMLRMCRGQENVLCLAPVRSRSLSRDTGPEASEPSEDLCCPSACVYVVVQSYSPVVRSLCACESRSGAVGFLNDDTLYTSHARPDNSEVITVLSRDSVSRRLVHGSKTNLNKQKNNNSLQIHNDAD